MTRIGLFVIAGAFLAACAAGTPTSGAGSGGAGGAGGSATGGANTGGSQPSCDDFTNTAPVFQKSEVAGSVPIASGGVVVDGTYFQTGDVTYTTDAPGPLGVQVRGTLVIAGSLWRRLYAEGPDVASSNDSCIVWTVSTSGTQLFADGSTTFSYSAIPTQIALYSGSNAVTFVAQ